MAQKFGLRQDTSHRSERRSDAIAVKRMARGAELREPCPSLSEGRLVARIFWWGLKHRQRCRARGLGRKNGRSRRTEGDQFVNTKKDFGGIHGENLYLDRRVRARNFGAARSRADMKSGGRDRGGRTRGAG